MHWERHKIVSSIQKPFLNPSVFNENIVYQYLCQNLISKTKAQELKKYI